MFNLSLTSFHLDQLDKYRLYKYFKKVNKRLISTRFFCGFLNLGFGFILLRQSQSGFNVIKQ